MDIRLGGDVCMAAETSRGLADACATVDRGRISGAAANVVIATFATRPLALSPVAVYTPICPSKHP